MFMLRSRTHDLNLKHIVVLCFVLGIFHFRAWRLNRVAKLYSTLTGLKDFEV